MVEKVIIIDFGSQYTQLIARRVRELEVYCEIYPCTNVPELDSYCKAVILSGSPFSVNDEKPLSFDLHRVVNHFPVLGICYGAQLIAKQYGGHVSKAEKREYGKAALQMVRAGEEDPFFSDIEAGSQIWMSHSDSILELPEMFRKIAETSSIPIAAFKSEEGTFDYPVYGIQFHPEVSHTVQGLAVLDNFLRKVVGCKSKWTSAAFVSETVAELKEKIGKEHVLMGLSGGVDSTVAASLLHEAIGDQLICFFVDNGLLRLNEFEEVLEGYQQMGLRVVGVDAKETFLTALQGVFDPEEKRKVIGGKFIEVFEAEAAKLENIEWLGQGTIYPDVIESISVHGPSATIKSHHNVGGLPDVLQLKIVEPLRMLFKDEVRKVGRELDIPQEILNRHPFPGPGLGIRILGEITQERIELCQKADAIFIDHLKDFNNYHEVWQAGTILLPVKSVGVMGDERTYEYTLALRCVNSLDGMTADWSKLSHELLGSVSNEIINKVKGINRVVYDISTKPPATIEWE